MQAHEKVSLFRSRAFWVVTVSGVLLFAAAAMLLDFKELNRQIAHFPAPVVILLVCLLPLLGVPVTPLFVLAGMRFGAWGGLAWTAFSIAIHLLLSYWIAHSFLRRPIEAILHRTRYRLPTVPDSEHVSFTLWMALVPGFPYGAKNYLLALGGVPLKPYFLTCLPAHVLHATLGVFLGHITSDPNALSITLLVVYAGVMAYLTRRIVRRFRKTPEAFESVRGAARTHASP